ncbi:MAG: AarF/ABC1/UbiB kinase family protein [Planctomycetota bacterium]
MRITAIRQYERNAKRTAEIVSILGKYGIARWLGRGVPEFLKSYFTNVRGEPIAGLPVAVRVRMAAEELGPTFIKIGQVLSTRSEIVGPELAKELAELQSRTPPDPFETVRATIEEELEGPLAEHFAEFDEEPIASASIGQAHTAKLLDGTDVVVKVQHPGIEERVRTDLEILDWLAGLAEQYDDDLRSLRPRSLVAEFRRVLRQELDFGAELRNIQQFRSNFEDDPRIEFPVPFPEHSSRRVLTMSRIAGYSIAEKERMERDGVDTREFAWLGANVYLEMIFRDGLFHADPHPGNVFVLPGGRIGLLDCGMVGRIDDSLRDELETLLLAAIGGDEEQLTRTIVRLGSVPPEFDRTALRIDVSDFLSTWVEQSVEDFDVSGALTELLSIVRRHGIVLLPQVAMLIKVLVMLEGTSRVLDPTFSLAELLEPYTRAAVRRRASPIRLAKRAFRAAREWERLFEKLPGDLSEIAGRASEGRFHVQLQHKHLDAAANRLTYGIVTAALFVGSALLWSSSVPPVVMGVPVLGAIGTLVSGLFAFRLLRAIRRQDDLG